MSSPIERALERAENAKRDREAENAKRDREARVPRIKPVEAWTPADHLTDKRGGEVLNPAYEAARRDALRSAGFEDEPQDKPAEEWTVEDHLKATRRR